MSMYAEYIRENTLGDILETKCGFATYVFTPDNDCYIKDIYVHPDFRNSKEATDMANTIVSIAKKRGCKKLIGSVVPSAKNSTRSLKVLLGYGFTLESSSHDFIVFKKEI